MREGRRHIAGCLCTSQGSFSGSSCGLQWLCCPCPQHFSGKPTCIMVLLETEYEDILRYVLMILASVAKMVAYVQENLSVLREVIAGLSLGPAEYDLHHKNRGYGPVMTVIQENSFSASLCIFALTSYGMITWIVVLAATQKIKEVVYYPRSCSRTRKKRFQRTSSSSRKMMKSMLFCILVYSNLQAASATERALQQLG